MKVEKERTREQIARAYFYCLQVDRNNSRILLFFVQCGTFCLLAYPILVRADFFLAYYTFVIHTESTLHCPDDTLCFFIVRGKIHQ